MPKHNLTFDCNNVEISSCNATYFRVDIETSYLDELLNNLSTTDIIDYYSDIEALYYELKERFEE